MKFRMSKNILRKCTYLNNQAEKPSSEENLHVPEFQITFSM